MTGWGREIPQWTGSQLAARLFPFCLPLLSLTLLLGCAPLPQPGCPCAQHCPGSTHETMDFPVRAALSGTCVHFSAFAAPSPRKNRAPLSRSTKPGLRRGEEYPQTRKSSPSPVYSPGHSGPFSQWPINSTFIAHPDGPDFSCLRWHSQISKYFLVECSV